VAPVAGAGVPSGGRPIKGITAASASMDTCDVAVDGNGNLVIADPHLNEVRMVAEQAGLFFGQTMQSGYIYDVAGDSFRGYSGDGGPAGAARLSLPGGVAVDGGGNLVVTDSNNNVVRVVAASTGTFYGQAMTAGDIYTVAGDGTPGYAGDGGPAAGAQLDFPRAVSLDGNGNLVIADTASSAIRVVAASTGEFYGQAMTAGDIYTVAGDGTLGYSGNGGPATSAELDWPHGVAVDGAGNLIVTDNGNAAVRVVAASTGTFYRQAMTVGDIYTVPGDVRNGYQGDGGPGTKARLDSPEGVAVDGAGNLVIADATNERVRMVTG
jgi:NHL repeat-containing protein